MKYLMTQEEFEILLGRNPDVAAPKGTTVIYFTANWCGACKRLDMERIETECSEVNWLKCDVDQNTYTPGYCGITAIPTFLMICDGKLVGQPLRDNNTDTVIDWVKAAGERILPRNR